MKKFLLSIIAVSTLAFSGILPNIHNAEAADEATVTTQITVNVVSGGLTSTATSAVAFGDVEIGATPAPRPVTLNVTNKTGSAGWNATVRQSAPTTGDLVVVNYAPTNNVGSGFTANTAKPLTTTALQAHKTSAVTTAATSASGNVSLTLPHNVTKVSVNRTLTWVVSMNP